jgi:Secretion system C-terminal sorting domain
MTDFVKCLTIFLFLLVSPSGYSQWTTSNVNVGTTGLAFKTADTGFSIANVYVMNLGLQKCLYSNTSDKGNSWTTVDTTTNFFSNGLAYGNGWGISYGKLKRKAAVEVFMDDVSLRQLDSFPNLLSIDQVNIVHADSAVFRGKGLDTLGVIGVMVRSGLNISVIILDTMEVEHIDFFSSTKGYFSIKYPSYPDSLYLTHSLGKSKILVTNSHGLVWDFLNVNEGICMRLICSWTGNCYNGIYHTQDAGSTWEYITSIGPQTNVGVINLIMNSKNTAYAFGDIWNSGNSNSIHVYLIDLKNKEWPLVSKYDGCCMFYGSYDYGSAFFGKDQVYFSVWDGILFYTLNNGSYTGFQVFGEDIFKFRIYPNPANSSFRIQGSKLPKSLSLYDLKGRKIMNFEYQEEGYNIESLKKGVYLLRIEAGNQVQFKKLIKG